MRRARLSQASAGCPPHAARPASFDHFVRGGETIHAKNFGII
jgi:hypothetical protein